SERLSEQQRLLPGIHLLTHARDAIEPSVDREVERRAPGLWRIRQILEQVARPARGERALELGALISGEHELWNDRESLSDEHLGGALQNLGLRRGVAGGVMRVELLLGFRQAAIEIRDHDSRDPRDVLRKADHRILEFRQIESLEIE